ncbi:hypothetical protein QEW03_004779 [Salmonella enterica]|uniref:Uncharacterized protein n=2 Tax=Salmonella enterica TaxID=28901 RepID=A0A5Z7SND9_SALER|nr:hypothetical protein [Salmonella enterica subsp. diarizonae]EAS4230282.1 hypothetical protein [Salmonella enterica]EBP3999390.1 hypothetical protein [Salmonella enterica subsp. enterica]EBQ9002618.1 hypothetical protein [Salmonella enterica subsp. enterica serovar Blockley]EBS0795405.1 hypothetical protein [Salmonella enterica subsp. enterica serovar Overschie]EBW4112758.1 hypothetical protein [Salmonella enterica subsp. enterica serovar Oranienburg]ECD5540218.1 hypothetical protein [Salmo
MSTLIRINVTNNSPFLHTFFFFQQPSVYTGGSEVFSNSLLSTAILPAAQGGSVYTFLLNLQYYAGVQQRHGQLTIGQPSGYASAIQSIELTPATGAVNNCTTMINKPALGLKPPVQDSGVQKGAFRIISPTYNPTLEQYNGGSAVRMIDGSVVLSNFVTVNPGSNLDCQPVLKFYVQVGEYTAGTVMNFTSSSVDAALCDATEGYTTFNVVYNADGTWTVTPGVSKMSAKADAHGNLLFDEQDLNTDIYNEAGTDVICRGYTTNTTSPFTVTHLTYPDKIHYLGAYMLSVDGGPRTGTNCTLKNNATAQFTH